MIKSVVLPFEVFDKMNSASAFTNNKNEMLETELRKVLDDKKLDPDEKRLMYSQLLHKYVKSVQDLKADVVLPVNSTTANTSTSLTNISRTNAGSINGDNSSMEKWQSLLDVASNKVNAKAVKNLFDYISNLPSVDIDAISGEIRINGEKINGSNIVDVILDLASHPLKLKKSKSGLLQSPPIGTYNLLHHLKENNIPQTFIKNTARYDGSAKSTSSTHISPKRFSNNSSSAEYIPLILSQKIKPRRLRRFTPYNWKSF